MMSHPCLERLGEFVSADTPPRGLTLIHGADVTLTENVGWILFAVNFNRHDVTEAAMLICTRKLSLVLLGSFEPS